MPNQQNKIDVHLSVSAIVARSIIFFLWSSKILKIVKSFLRYGQKSVIQGFWKYSLKNSDPIQRIKGVDDSE